MSGFENFFRSRAARAAVSYINNEIGDIVGDIDDPTLRNAAQNLLDTAIPGLGGGTPDYRDNVFEAIIGEKLSQSILEKQRQIDQQVITQTSETLEKKFDWRARLRPKDGGKEDFYAQSVKNGFDDYLMRPIQDSGGLVWKHTPSVLLSGSAIYNSQEFQGSNYPINVYDKSTPPRIPVTADFTANDVYEARYLLAVITFLRVATKSYFGDASVVEPEEGGSAKYGTPPPVLLFEYLGAHGFYKVPVVVESYTISLENTVDYVPVVVNGTTTYVPTMTNIMVNITPTFTPHKLRRVYDLEGIANGVAYQGGFI